MSPRRTRIALTVIAALAAAVTVAGCGFGAGPGTKDASIEVTTNFGTHLLGTAVETKVPGAQTDMALLQSHFTVTTRYGGGFVQSINGLAGHNDRTNWFYYVNGILASKGAAATDVYKGDHDWWDLQNWTVAQPKAVVGSYPEPFTNGINGREAPTLLTCGQRDQNACNIVGASLRKVGIKAGDQELGTGTGDDSNAIVVGTWHEIQDVLGAQLIDSGPRLSGVFAEFVGDSAVELENPIGSVVRTLRGSVGLIAATQTGTQIAPVWFVTGTDAAAVTAAARDLTPALLHNHFAVVIDAGHVIPVPVTAKS